MSSDPESRQCPFCDQIIPFNQESIKIPGVPEFKNLHILCAKKVKEVYNLWLKNKKSKKK